MKPTIDWKAFERYVEHRMELEHIPGAAIAVSVKGETVFRQGFGKRDITANEPVTPETIFGIASITKSFTALAIMKLAEEGRLSVDDPVISYIPELKLYGLADMSKVRIYHLLMHTTGQPLMFRDMSIVHFRDHLRYLATEAVERLGEPGEIMCYCNDTFLLLGLIIERVTGALHRRYVTAQLMEPLGMNRSTFSQEELLRMDNVTSLYIQKSGGDHFVEQVPWRLTGTYEVGGGIKSNIDELLAYANMYALQSGRIVSAGSLRQMWNPEQQNELIPGTSYAYALRVTRNYDGRTLVYHGGSNPGVSAQFGFVPEAGIAAVVLTNVQNVDAFRIWLSAINTALGLPIEQKRPAPPMEETTPEQVSRLSGVYATPPRTAGGELRIDIEDQAPVLYNQQKRLRLSVRNSSMLTCEESGTTYRFYYKAGDSVPWAMHNGNYIYVRQESSNENSG